MTVTTFAFPNTIHFGPGARHRLPEIAAGLGQRPLVVTDPGVRSLDLFGELVEQLGGPSVFDGVAGNPDTTHVDAGAATYREHGCDLVIGVGGGSPLDAAKAIALKVSHAGCVTDYDDRLGGYERIGPGVPPIVAVPTTAGTGSEVGRSSVVTNPESQVKTVIFSPYLLPRVAFIDPELMLDLPPKLTAATGMDALSHNVEAFLAKGYHPMCDGIAIEAIGMIVRALPIAVEDGHDLQARSDMAMASAMGAVAFQKGLGATHSLAHPLSTICGLHHGLANALFLDRVMVFNRGQALERLARVGRSLGLEGDVASRADGAIEAVRALARRIGIPERLGAVGVTEDQLEALVEQAVNDACHLSNPRPVSRDDFRQLYRGAL
jgi:alcohol dehydrogenase class IV